MKKLVYTRADGGVSVATPVINTHTLVDGKVVPVVEQLTEQQAIDRLRARLPADARVVDAVPADRTYRGAWVVVGERVEVDMPKARNIQRDRMRAVRKEKLAALDAEYMRADELGDPATKNRIAMQKQALRDVTDDAGIEVAATPEALKNVWPEVLK